jgi:hypothetical protein
MGEDMEYLRTHRAKERIGVKDKIWSEGEER